MKKLDKFLLLAVIWLNFLWLCYAQNLDSFNNGSLDSFNNGSVYVKYDSYAQNYSYASHMCACITPFRTELSYLFLILIWFILVILSLCSITLYKKYKDKLKYPIILCIPLLNLYQAFKITIWRIRFYCLILFVWFFGYLIYSNRDWCCSFSDELVYPVIVVWLLSICILLVFLIKLIIISRKSDKEPSHGQN